MTDDDGALLARLNLEEKASVLSGKDHWSLPALPRIGLESIVMSDGPVGVKCGRDGPATPPTVPCGTALAATWNPELVEEVASLLGETARVEGVHVLLAPATNILRSPLGGRNFEYYSEDPLLAATITRAYVRGVQREGVAATVKHFVCNDVESSRMTGNVEIDEQTLREIYLLPFETAVRDADAWVVMCSYNKLRGTYLAAHPLLDELLRDDLGFTGVVVSDWGAVHDTVPSSLSGLDVEMPGPPVFRGAKLVAAVRSGEVPERAIDEKVLRILRLARRTGALGSPPDRRRRRSSTETAAVLRRAAAESFVLLKNDGNLLPLAPRARIAVLGRLAAVPPLQGGGSANVGPLTAPSPLEGIRAFAGAEVSYAPGYVPGAPPRLDLTWVDGGDGTSGFAVELRDANNPAGPPIETRVERTEHFVFREVEAGRPLEELVVRVRATLTPPVDGEYVFGVNCAGSGTLRIDGDAMLELDAEHDLDWSYLYRPETRGRASVVLEADKPVPLELEYRMAPGRSGQRIGLIALRAQAPEPEDLLRAAVACATDADVAVVFAGLGEEHESEGFDRTTLELPPEQQELITSVAAANPATVVVLSAGAPVSLEWSDQVPAILLVWYAGQELCAALGEVLMGHVEPGGRLPMTLPARADDVAVLDPAPDDDGTWHYSEGLFVGYRHFDRYRLEPAYCFGHGLSYTRFDYEELHVERNGAQVEVSVRIRNRGGRRGKEVVQVYIGSGDPSRPLLELKTFDCMELDPGAVGSVTFTLGERAFSRWDSELGHFAPILGRHEIAVGRSSRDLRLRENIEVGSEPDVRMGLGRALS